MPTHLSPHATLNYYLEWSLPCPGNQMGRSVSLNLVALQEGGDGKAWGHSCRHSVHLLYLLCPHYWQLPVRLDGMVREHHKARQPYHCLLSKSKWLTLQDSPHLPNQWSIQLWVVEGSAGWSGNIFHCLSFILYNKFFVQSNSAAPPHWHFLMSHYCSEQMMLRQGTITQWHPLLQCHAMTPTPWHCNTTWHNLHWAPQQQDLRDTMMPQHAKTHYDTIWFREQDSIHTVD